MTQNRALQLLFDLRYLNTMLSSRLDEGKSSRTHQDPRYQSFSSFVRLRLMVALSPPVTDIVTMKPHGQGL